MILNLNSENPNKKKFAFLTGMIVSVLAILVLTVGNPAFAQPVFTDKLDFGYSMMISHCGNIKELASL